MAQERRCIACRAVAGKQDLVRFVFDGKVLVVDWDNCMPGRGAYVHRQRDCLDGVLKVRFWERAFRLEKNRLETDAVAKAIGEVLEKLNFSSLRQQSGTTNVKLRL